MLIRTAQLTKLATVAAFTLATAGSPAWAQDTDDKAPTLTAEEAVEPTQEELDAVGGLPGQDKEPTLAAPVPAPGPSVEGASTEESAPAKEEPAAPATEFISVRLGGGLSMISTPAFNDTFSVRDDSASQSIYGFTAEVGSSEQQIQLSIGGNYAWELFGATEVGVNFDFGYAPLGGSAGVISFLMGPSLGYKPVDDVIISAAAGMGYLGYRFGFDVQRESTDDVYMTFNGTDIYFDDSGEANMSMTKGGLVMAPEVAVSYRPLNGAGVILRAQYLMHTINTDSPWDLTFSETTTTSTSSESGVSASASESATISYEGRYVAGTPLPKAFNFSGLMFLMEVQWGAPAN